MTGYERMCTDKKISAIAVKCGYEEISGTGLRAGVSEKPKADCFRRFAAETGRDASPTERKF